MAEKNENTTAVDFSAYPLSSDLTRRVLNYLNIFRLTIALIIAFAYFTGATQSDLSSSNPAFTGAILTVYLATSIYFIISWKRKGTDYYQLGVKSLLSDVILQSALLYSFGGLGSGIGLLLMFTGAAAAVILPLRVALFIAAIATLGITSGALIDAIFSSGRPNGLTQAGLYGIISFVIAVLSHMLAFWARDYRLTAEKSREDLGKLQQINELIIRRMRTGVVVISADCQILLMNESAWFLLGSPSASDKNLDDLSPELVAAVKEWQKGQAPEQSVTLAASQVTVIPRFVTLPSDEQHRTLVFLEDNDLVARRALELSAGSLSNLSASIAHEIRNPLAALKHAAQLLDESEHLKTQDHRLLDIIKNHASRMNRIVQNILQLARREQSQPEIIQLKPWLETFVDEFRSAVPAQVIHICLEEDLSDVTVLFDPSQLHQVVWKLMENAVDHAGREGEDKQIIVRLEIQHGAGYCVITVEDNGVGIPDNLIHQIFEPFFTTRKEGSGLGLHIARQLCDANQSELTVDSSAEYGTRFHIRLMLSNRQTYQPETLVSTS